MRIAETNSATVFPLRHAVLRPGRPEAEARYPQDDAPTSFHVAAFDDDVLAGCATAILAPAPGQPGQAYQLRGMAVAEERRNQGLGAQILAEVEAGALRRGARTIWCNGRTVARTFYERHGWLAQGREFDLAGRPHLVFSKRLGPTGPLPSGIEIPGEAQNPSKGSPVLAIAFTVGLLATFAPSAAALPAISDTAAPDASTFTYAQPDAAEVARVKEAFRDAAARSVNDRSGQLFFLPAKYDYLKEKMHGAPSYSHIHGRTIPMQGTTHGTNWEYDTHIPLVLWGPGVVRAGVRTEDPATQQDLAPTYARLMATDPPDDAGGRVLTEALLDHPHTPKVILTVVFDQGGEVYYRAHPGATPFIDRMKAEGTYFAATYVSHLDSETGIGHSAIGTGAWPGKFGISSNSLYMPALGGKRYAFDGETKSSPIFLTSPTLGDVWLHRTHGRAHVLGYCYADRAAIGMAGHGTLYAGNPKPWVVFYDEKQGVLTTNPRYYQLPAELVGRSPAGYLDALTRGTGTWMGHAVDPKDSIRSTPAYARFDGDNIVRLIQGEPLGQAGVTDLLYVNLKSTDACGHAFGHESDEAGAVLHEQDHQLQRIVEALVAKVGRDDVLVALTADHGSTPLPELSGGTRLLDDRFVGDLNRKLDHLDNGVDLVEYASAEQLFVNEAERVRNHVTWAELEQAILDYRVDGKPYFIDVMTRDEARERAKKFEAP